MRVEKLFGWCEAFVSVSKDWCLGDRREFTRPPADRPRDMGSLQGRALVTEQ